MSDPRQQKLSPRDSRIIKHLRAISEAGTDAELFAEQGALFTEPVILCCESYPCMDVIGGPGARIYDSVVGQRDRMEYRRLNACPASPWEDGSAVAADCWAS